MDARFEDISVGLYVRETGDGPVATIHSYSRRQGTDARLDAIAKTMCELGGLQPTGNAAEVRFACKTWHGAAAKRLFIEACKQDPATPVQRSPLSSVDARSSQEITVVPLGDGAYEVTAAGATDETPSRAPAIARAIAKLAQLDLGEERPTVVAFPCGQAHDELVGLLLVRAQNLRQILREEELAANRGVLSAPSGQQ